MRCLTYLLLLPETLKKSRKVGRLPLCYELLAPSLASRKKQKMAAELYPAANTNLSGTTTAATTTVADAEKPTETQVKQAAGGGGSPASSPSSQQNINNNNVDPPSWQSSHPTLRERYQGRAAPCTLVPRVLGGGD